MRIWRIDVDWKQVAYVSFYFLSDVLSHSQNNDHTTKIKTKEKLKKTTVKDETGFQILNLELQSRKII